MNITIWPLGRGRFAASIGQRVHCQSKTPFFTAARILQREGIPDDTPISMKHEGSDVIAIRSTVGEAASRIVEETDAKGPRFKRYRPMASEMPQHRVREQSQATINETEVGRPRNESEQLSLWDLPLPDEAPDPRVRLGPRSTVETGELRETGCGPEQLSFFASHLLGDCT